jgi:hypothetical protein
MKPRTSYDPATSQYCCPVIIDTEEPAGSPWHMAYFDVDVAWNGYSMQATVTEVVASDGRSISIHGLDMEWLAEQCIDELSAANRDDTLIWKRRAA